jgi:carboxymethylenebutenolidase
MAEKGGRRVEISAEGGGGMEAYLAAPWAGSGPAVVLVSSIFGVDDFLEGMCDDLAHQGCVAIAPNFFWRDEDAGPLPNPAGMQRAVARAGRIDFPKSMKDLRHAIAEAKRHPACNGKVAVFGFCFGGPHAWRSACDGLDVQAAVSFHGTFVSKYIKPGDQPKCPVALYYGDHDDLAPPPELETVKAVADATGSEFVVFAGAGHGFTLANGDHYHPEAARESWERALAMLEALKA